MNNKPIVTLRLAPYSGLSKSTKRSDNAKTDKANPSSWQKLIKGYLIGLLNALIFSFPVALKCINYYLPDLVKSLPTFLEDICSAILSPWFLLLYYAVATPIVYNHFTAFDYQQKEFSSLRDSDFTDSFQSFINKLTTLCSSNLALNQVDDNPENFPDKFSSFYNFGRIKAASITGNTVDYFSVVYPFFINPFCRFFYISRYTSKKNAVKYLIGQGFDFCGTDNNVLHFCKGGNLHVRLACQKLIPGILGLEVTRESVDSDLSERLKEEYEEFTCFFSLDSLLSEIKSIDKKDKAFIALSLFALAAGLCLVILVNPM